jgi:hypothetical protein
LRIDVEDLQRIDGGWIEDDLMKDEWRTDVEGLMDEEWTN